MPRITIERHYATTSWWTGEKQPHKKHLVVRIPPISAQVKAVIASKLSKEQPWLLEKSNVDQAQSQAKAAYEKLHQFQKNLDSLREEREQALLDVTEVRGKQLQTSLKEMEEQLRNEVEEEILTKDQECQIICEEMEAKMMSAIRDKQMEILKKRTEDEATAEAEPPTKRLKLEEGESEGIEENVTHVLDEPAKESEEIEQRKRDIELAKQKADKLEETKKQMVWLLKQVIKAEAKQQMAKIKLEKDSETVAYLPEAEDKST